MDLQKTLLNTDSLIIGYHAGKKQEKAIAGPLDLELHAGELICLLGPNGCGKSTLLRTIAGLQQPLSGGIILDGADLLKMKPAALAKKLSLVLTDNVRSGNLDVGSVVALGRYPYSGWLGVLSENDKAIIDHAMAVTHTTAFTDRKMESLSDGECQKVMLARAVAQDTPLVILDEPTAHLDLPSRIQLMRLLHQLARETNKAILISTHELDLALQAADCIWLMDSDGHLAAGLPEELILNGSLQNAFDKDGITFDVATGHFHLHHGSRKLIAFEGEGIAAFWTRKALIRNGFTIADSGTEISAQMPKVRIAGDGRTAQWMLGYKGVSTSYKTLTEFLNSL